MVIESNQIEENILKVIGSEKWTANPIDIDNPSLIRKQIILTNRESLELIIEKNHERITIKKTVTISNKIGDKISGALKQNFKYDFKVFLLPMDIYIQVYSESEDIRDLDTIHVLYRLYFDEFSKNKFYHMICKMGEIQRLFDTMQEKFISSHPKIS